MKDIVKAIKSLLDSLIDHDPYVDSEAVLNDIAFVVDKYLKEQASKTFYDRLKEEREEVKERFTKLTAFINNEELFSKVTKKQQYLLKEQSTAMSDYLYILNQRLFEYKREK